MRIAVLGTGDVGRTLGQALTGAGHDVAYGSRAPGSTPAALDHADVVVLAVPGPAVAALATEHAAALAGRLVIDATNTMTASGPLHSRAAVTAAAPTARYARAFNSYGFENFRTPRFGDDTASLLYACASADRPVLERLVTDVGLRPEWLGEDGADVLDGITRAWFALSRQHGRHVALKVLTD
jgi:8-hydroxy-5-deazaflavin:NADPH oxidoreductase